LVLCFPFPQICAKYWIGREGIMDTTTDKQYNVYTIFTTQCSPMSERNDITLWMDGWMVRDLRHSEQAVAYIMPEIV